MVSPLYLCSITLNNNNMPNWCSNHITITGNKKVMRQLKSIFNSMDNDTENVFELLIGRSRSDLPKKLWESGAWYDGNINHFGCKWDVSYSSLNIDISDDVITLSPETAWSPPEEFCRELSKIYGADVTIQFFEPGCDFSGKSNFSSNGNETSENYSYREGLYLLEDDDEMFFSEIESDIEYEMENEPEDRDSPQSFANRYPYLSVDDRNEVIRLYEESLKMNSTVDND